MILLSDFLKKVILDIFKYTKNSEKFLQFGVSRNSFAYYIDYNNATKLGTRCNKALKRLIFSEIEKSKSKEDELIIFFKSFLTKKELDNYDNNQIINSVIDKFSEKKVSKNTLNKFSEFKKEDSANNIKIMFESAIEYFDKDPFTALIYSEKISKKIVTDIKFFEEIASKNKNLLKVLNQKEIIPSDICLYINNITEINSVILNSSNSSKVNLYKSTKINITNIVEWYLNDYLNIYKYRIKTDKNHDYTPDENYNIQKFFNLIKKLKIEHNSFGNNIELSRIEKKIILKKRELKNLYIEEPKNILLFNYSNELISNFKKDLDGFYSKELMEFELHYCYMLINTGVLDNVLIARESLNNIIKNLVEYIDIDFRMAQIYENAEWLYSITYCIENNINKAFKICEKAISNLEKSKSDKLILTRELFVLSKDESYTKEIIKGNNHFKYDIIEEFHTYRRLFEYYISKNNKEKSREMFIKTNSIFKLIISRLDKIYIYMFYKNVYFFFRLIGKNEYAKLYYKKAIEGFSKYGFIGQLKKLENLIL